MSARKFARDVPRAVQAAVRVALELAGPSGEVPGGMPALQEALGHDTAAATRAVVAQAETWKLLRRVGPIGHGPRRLFVVEARLVSCEPGACTNCGADTSRRTCVTCKAAFRRDREWRMLAVSMLVAGKTLPAIAAACSQPLYPASGDGPSVGVVAFLLGEVPSLVPIEWREGYRVVVGAEVPKVAMVLTSRARQRRKRRKVA